MLDSDQEPTCNLSKNLLLLPRILKLIKDMVDDSTPLLRCPFHKEGGRGANKYPYKICGIELGLHSLN